MNLEKLVKQRIRQAGGLRSLSRRIDVCPGYLSRLSSGEKINPSDDVLKKLRIERVIVYRSARDAGKGEGGGDA